MATTSTKSKESYTISFHNCKMIQFEKEKSTNPVRWKVLNQREYTVVTKRFNFRFLRDYQVTRQQDLYIKID